MQHQPGLIAERDRHLQGVLDLTGWGWQASPELVRAIMREQEFQPCQPRPWRFSLTDADAGAAPIPDLVRRDFTADAPG
jgi:hypothetical protein